jgi:hypothetical protein
MESLSNIELITIIQSCSPMSVDIQTLAVLPREFLEELALKGHFEQYQPQPESEPEPEAEVKPKPEPEVEPEPEPEVEPKPEPEPEPEPEVEPESEGEFPLPQFFLAAISEIEAMGFVNRPRIIELLITNSLNKETTIMKLVEERDAAVSERKAEVKKELIALLDSPFGDRVLSQMAELSIAEGKNDMLANFVALANSGNDLAEARSKLDEE